MLACALIGIAAAAAAAPPEAPPYLAVPRPPWPRVMLHHLLSSDDYPAAALRNEESGDTDFRLAVGRDGRVTACAITGSSGSSALDSATCRLMKARALFDPARSRSGRPLAGRFDGRISWRLAE
ncbi:MAG TPA: TonB family protein [Allosphingosinicella sp.]|jgi:protein TonB